MKTGKSAANPVDSDVTPTPPQGAAVGGKNPESRRLIGFLAFAVLLAALFFPHFASLVKHATRSDLHSYIVLVPFISAYLIYIQREQLPKVLTSSPGWAIFPLVAGLVAFAAAHMRAFHPLLSENDDLTLIAFSFVCFLATGGFFLVGRAWMKAAAFPFAFLLFMLPLPDRAVYYMETGSKLASAEAAAFFFSMAGMPVFRTGTVFQLPGIVIEVAQECSGIRSSWILFITSLLASHVFLLERWRRIVLVAVVIPLGIVRNGFRIFVVGSLCVHFGPQMIDSLIHRRGGPLFFGLSLVPLFLLLWWLRRGEKHTRLPD